MIAASVWHRWLSAVSLALACAAPSFAQPAPAPQFWLAPIPNLPLASDASNGNRTLRQPTQPLQPFTVAGKCGAFVGRQDGSFEAWTWPLKLLSHFRIEAHLADYSIPIDVNAQSAEIEVAPDRTVITYSHAAFTIREILFAPQCSQNGSGVMAFFQIDSIRPLTLTFNFTPEVKRMWPAENPNAPSPEWIKLPATTGPQPAGSEPDPSGYYLLHTDFPNLAGAIAMPHTQPGILAPYQERPKDYPLQLILHYDPIRDGQEYFPLIMAAGDTAQTASPAHLLAELQHLGVNAQTEYQDTADYYQHFFDHRLTAQTPDPRIDQALRWAELSIDQLRVQHRDEVALVAGLYSSGDSTRPGFGWFFGRDALYTLYAIDSYGDFPLARQEFEFLLKRQRADGKIMHEFSQTAEDVDWAQFPYEYAAADATPLFLMAMADYVASSGDTAFIREHSAQIDLAWNFERTHDSDGDGIYDNSQGTGWVESWIPSMPKQEIYMAALDQQASQAYARLATILGKPSEAEAARTRAQKIANTLEQEYRIPAPTADPTTGPTYAFSRNAGASPNPAPGQPALVDSTQTIYPAIAYWDGDYALQSPDAIFESWASSDFSTDWGARDVSQNAAIYDPISYHQGSVWPLFTGWASLAEYRSGRPLSAYAHLMQNLDLTWAQDLGAVTELLSGAYFQPLGRSTTHQLWSSAMVLTPAIRGLFGVSAHGGTITVDPHLPATWDHATLHHVPTGDGTLATLVFTREGPTLSVRAEPETDAPNPPQPAVHSQLALKPYKLSGPPKLTGPAGSTIQSGHGGQAGTLHIPLPPAELAIPATLPLPGARTTQLKVLAQHTTPHTATWLLEAQGGSTYTLPLRLNGIPTVQAEGANLKTADPHPATANPQPHSSPNAPPPTLNQTLEIHFPRSPGYTQQTVTVRW